MATLLTEDYLRRKDVSPVNEKILSEDDFTPVKREEIYRDEEHGFKVVKEFFKEGTSMESAYTLDDKYIGREDFAKSLCIKRGIKPTTFDNNKVCSIGFSESEQAWYGWSHRGFSLPFKVGYKVQSDDVCLGCFGPNEKSVPLGFEAKNLDDCKRLAIAYAYSVA